MAQRREGDGRGTTLSQYGPIGDTGGLWVKTALERQDLYRDECRAISELQDVAIPYASPFLAFRPKSICV